MAFVKKYDDETTTLLNAIRGSSTALYTERVPVATKDNLELVADAILNYSTTRDEFVQSLIDRIAFTLIKSANFKNPLTMFKRGTKDYGKDIQEIFVDLIKATSFDPKLSASEVEKIALPNVLSVFHTTNRRDKYKVTINDAQLRNAFTDEGSMSTLVNYIISALYTSDEVDEFELMKAVIRVCGKSGKLAMRTVTAPTDEASVKSVMKTIKKISNDMLFPSTAKSFNHANVINMTPKEHQVIIVNTDFDASVDVELLASAFNMTKTDFEMRKIIIDDFGGLTNVVAIVCDYQWLMVWDDLLRSTTRQNEDGLYYNTWLHHHETLTSSPFANAVAIVTQAPTLTAIDLLPATATVVKGESLQLNVEGTGTNNPPLKCTYAHNGVSAYTYINSLGFLVVGSDETQSPLTITATSTFNGAISDTAIITLA